MDELVQAMRDAAPPSIKTDEPARMGTPSDESNMVWATSSTRNSIENIQPAAWDRCLNRSSSRPVVYACSSDRPRQTPRQTSAVSATVKCPPVCGSTAQKTLAAGRHQTIAMIRCRWMAPRAARMVLVEECAFPLPFL
jgi:hypothetical protein